MRKRFKYGKLLFAVGLIVIGAGSIYAYNWTNRDTWNFDGKKWSSSRDTPDCPTPLLSVSPVDTTLATSILYPGQYRGTDYKAHGGFRFDTSRSESITVRAPMDANVVNVSRYRESGEVQYLLTFINDCGVAYRFDHLYTLAPKFQAIAEASPEPTDGQTTTTEIKPRVPVKAGEVIATAVGMPALRNVGVDFGVYDLRETTSAAQNARWATIHQNNIEQAYYGICWLEQLPAVDAERVALLPPGDLASKAISDYCTTPYGGTMRYNDGLPPAQ